MSEKMKKCIFLMVRTGLTQKDIAKELDIAEETISRWKSKDEFKELKLEEEWKYLGELTSPSIRTMEQLLEADSEHVRYSVASNILDRTGYKPTEKRDISVEADVKHNDPFKEMTREELLKLAGMEDMI
ncbi:helix-turn-helix domain-containing protein [Peptostreptococcus faecalis]|uniref:helix-turn-helix domain-containing protein n=1 Tax=Peptostreptococcus faecalis TaxID=2045015 RepID=UPI000C7D8805|nr:helix-turn-helix domain-containing protein [Peptostreptococcus faecalis]